MLAWPSVLTGNILYVRGWPRLRLDPGDVLPRQAPYTRDLPSGMDPTEAELLQINSLDDAMNWAGVETELQQTLMEALGQPSRVREITLIPRVVWDQAIERLEIQTEGPPPGGRRPTPVELARLESLRRVCNLRVGREADDSGALPWATPAVPGPPFPPMGGGHTTTGQARKIKLSAVLDPTLEAEIVPLGEQEVADMYNQYRAKFGDHPSADTDVSRDQLAAIRQVVAVGACPYADFSIWGPFGQRLLRKQSFQAFHLNPVTGDWQRREQPGPASFHQWYQSWKCYRTAMLLVEACEAERLDSYSELIRGFVQQYGEEAWPFVSQADSRMRSEQLDRIKRELRAVPAHGFEENKPWSACYAAAVKDTEFWQKELATPALLYLTRNKREQAPRASEQAQPGDQPTAKRTRPARRFTGEDKSKTGSDGLYTHNRKGIEVCRLFNQGKCGSEKAQGKCKSNRSHQCDRCLGPHVGTKCPRQN